MSHALKNAIFVLALIPAGIPPGAAAQDYPAREIRSICNFSAGSGADILVRYYSDRLSKLAGKPVVVENKVGVQGSIATEYVARSKADGYTIMITPASSTLAAARYMFKQLRFDPDKDFTPVTTLAKLSFAIAVDAKSPIRTIAELTEHLKKKPGHGHYATGSNTGQVTGELYKEMAGLSTTYVPYKETMSALTDTISGEVDFMTYDVLPRAAGASGTGAHPRGHLRDATRHAARGADHEGIRVSGLRPHALVGRGRPRRHAEADRRQACGLVQPDHCQRGDA